MLRKFAREGEAHALCPAIYVRDSSRILVWLLNEPVALIHRLFPILSQPFFLLYVLVVPRSENEPGRYESCRTLNDSEVTAFLDKYREYLEGDGRHHFWIGSVDGSGLLVYDRHEMLYLYGDLDRFESALQDSGYQPGDPLTLRAHYHGYNSEFDHFEHEITTGGDFRWTPLLPSDES